MLTETELTSDERAEPKGAANQWTKRRRKLWVAAILAGVVVFLGAWLKYSPQGERKFRRVLRPLRFPQVVVSKPLAQDIDTRFGLPWPIRGGFASRTARAQVGGTLTGIFFKDGGHCFGRATSFFTIDPRPLRDYARPRGHLPQLRRCIGLDWNWLTDKLGRAKDLEQSNAGKRGKTWTSAHPINEQARAAVEDAESPNPRCTVSTSTIAGLRRRSQGRMGTHPRFRSAI